MKFDAAKIYINGKAQHLKLLPSEEIYPISTAKKGFGERINSEQTPCGWHQIAMKIGEGMAENTVFVGRKATGEIYDEALAKQYPQRDWILTRILWLAGLEEGKNKGGDVDSYQRYIYIHGTPDSEPMGVPRSHGCIRMRNHHIIKLFDQLEIGDRVFID
ncbi:MAG: L,D-transpeptidase [Pseudomonadota bacterium]